MYKVILLTSDSLRHKYFFTKFIKSNVEVLACYSEKTKSLKNSDYTDLNNFQKIHFTERARVEKDFFEEYVNLNFISEKWNEVEKNYVNSKPCIDMIKKLNPDFIVCYGCSIIDQGTIDIFRGKILNVHLGLSPYYLGSATNFHPLCEGKPELIGYTFMFMDEGVDTGEIIHQGRCKNINVFDNSHHIGCKIIKQMSEEFIKVVENFKQLEKLDQPSFEYSKVCVRSDATYEKTLTMYDRFNNQMVLNYLKNRNERDFKYPILKQKFLK